jgi:hypothetical protein
MIGLGALGVWAPTPASAQAIPKSLEEGGTDEALKARKNTWTVGVAGGVMSGTNMIFADEMAQVLDDGDNLRVLPMVTYGAASNLEDLLYLRGVDVAITPVGRVRIFSVPAQDQQPRGPNQFHLAPADRGNARAGQK